MAIAAKVSNPETQNLSNSKTPTSKKNPFKIMESILGEMPLSIMAASTESGLENFKVINEKIREQLISSTDSSLAIQESAIEHTKKVFATYELASARALKTAGDGLENAFIIVDAVFSKANDSMQSFVKKQISE